MAEQLVTSESLPSSGQIFNIALADKLVTNRYIGEQLPQILATASVVSFRRLGKETLAAKFG